MRYRYYHRIYPNGFSYDVNAGEWTYGPWEPTMEAAVNHLRNIHDIACTYVEREDDDGRSVGAIRPLLYLRQDPFHTQPRWEAGQFAGTI